MMVGPESVDNLPSVASQGEARASLTLPHSKGFERAQDLNSVAAAEIGFYGH